MKLFRSTRGRILVAVVVLLALFLIRPGAGGLKTRIARAISLAVGRQVEIGNVRLRILPQPGFDLENFVVHDDPSFSAEPALRAQDVAATIRISSLLRGRLEVSSLSLSEASVNLVRNREGHWNIENLLERTARISVAPTSKARSERRPVFPYIEASPARINFKFEQEKKPYALTNADFSFWQDSENTWAMRLKAQPVRTDFNISDTGLVKVSGSWQRAPSLGQTPVQFTVQWERGQLGQLTKLVSGSDRGWRGTVSVALSFAGSPEDLNLTATSSIQDFRRYDIFTNDALRLAAHCVAHYSSSDRTLHQIICGAPVGDGTVTLQGDLAGVLARRDYDLTLSAEELPIQALINLARRDYDLTLSAEELPIQALINLARQAKRDLPQDLIARGTLNGTLNLRALAGGPALIAGDGQISNFRLRSALTRTELELGDIPLALASTREINGELEPSKISGRKAREEGAGHRLEIGPFTLPLGRVSSAIVHGWASRSGYDIKVHGDSDVQRALQIARTLGLPALQPVAQGTAKLDLQIAGSWSGFAPPLVTGVAQLNAVRAEVRGLNAPLAITSASLNFVDHEVVVQNLTASVGDSRWRGSLSLPRHCTSLRKCPLIFDLHTDELDSDELNVLFNPNFRKRPWYRLLSQQPHSSIFSELEASGKLNANRIILENLVGKHASADVEIRDANFHFSNLHAEVLGGTHTGNWQADFSLEPPVYRGTGRFDRVSLDQFAKMTHDGWITGTADASYRLKTTGNTTAELITSSQGEVQFDMSNGLLPHIAMGAADTPFHVRRFKARLMVTDGQLEIREGKLETAGGIYQVSGTASLGRNLNIRVVRDGSHAFGITGTVGAPRVVMLSGPETQAALKP